MKKFLITIIFFVLNSYLASAQYSITFQIEDLKKPDFLLRLNSYDDIWKNLILSDVDLSIYQIEKSHIDISYNIITHNKIKDSLVSFGYHSFFNGMYEAYSRHRAFVLSPDMIWLLISQGFAQHVNNNSEELRKHFVNFEGKATLFVNAKNDILSINNSDLFWNDMFSEFTSQIAGYTGNELIENLTSNFSTTTSVEKIASQITIMETMKPYFEFIVIYAVCGIPEITLEGTTEDWEKVLVKTRTLKKYDLDWWIDEIEPILEEFVNASRGEINKKFWRNMFKYHSQEEYGAPKIIDGWIVNFFPYSVNGRRDDLDEIIGDPLPSEINKVDMEYIITYPDSIITIPLELWAGFVGLEQNNNNFTLRPKIGWMIKKKDVDNIILKQKLNMDNSSDFGGSISIRVSTIPKVLFELKYISYLEVQFIDEINIPEELSNVKIDKFIMYGKITDSEIERICKLFPNTELIINDDKYNLHK